MRSDFISDNAAAMAPEALDALIAANQGFAKSYGADEITARAAEHVRQRFGADAEVRFVSSGTAANAIAISMLARPFESVLAYEEAHIRTDEAGAPGFVGHGVGLIGLPGPSGKIDQAALEARLAEEEVAYRQAPAALSLTQATEYGAVYTVDELRRLIEPARAKGLKIHLDGARLANAAAAGFDLPEVPRLGVDVCVLGGAKAGGLCVEALVMFDHALAKRVDNRLKQAGQLASKGRFLAAPLLGLLETGAWEGHAAHANLMAQRLASASPFPVVHPVEANMVFVAMDDAQLARVNAAGWTCYRFDDSSVRFVCSWQTTEGVVEELVAALRAAA
jgi:threonine aldolase